MIYLDSASAGVMSKKTTDIMLQYLEFEKNHGARLASKRFAKEIQQFYENVRKLISADSIDEIAFVDSSSRGINLIINADNIHKGDRILTLSSEFGTTLLALVNCANKVGAELSILPCQLDGNFSMENLEKILQEGINWIILSHVVAQGSIINPIEEIGKLAIKYKVNYIVDGCQAVGQVPVDVKKINCDAYIASGRKWLCGPRGTGFMYINKNSTLISPLLDVASSQFVFENNEPKIVITKSAKRFELWERNIANVIGLSQAIANWFEIERTGELNALYQNANIIRKAVIQNRKFQLIGNKESQLGTVGFFAKEHRNEIEFRNCLENNHIQISYLKNWECPMFWENISSKLIFRIAPHYFTSEKEIEIICKIISEF